MRLFTLCFMVLTSIINLVVAQTTGVLEDFNDNILTGWEAPNDQTAGTYTLTERDSMLRIDYNRNYQSYEWDNFNFTPFNIINATNTPYITIRVKSTVRTVLTLKPIYQNSNNDWLQVSLPADDKWHNYSFELIASKPYEINRIYMYLDGGNKNPSNGVVYFDDLRIADSVRMVNLLDLSGLERLINDANNLYAQSLEGYGEGEFEPGSKIILKASITEAEQFLSQADLTVAQVDSTEWVLADACMVFETSVYATDLGLIDPLATKETKYLYLNLDSLAGNNLLFGMHDATGYGVGWSGDDDRSDVKDVCGSYPAVYSEDLNKVDRNQQVERMRYRLSTAYNRGGLITMCWHQYDPQGRGFYSKDTHGENIVASLLPGGKYHQFYKERLHNSALFFKTLRGASGESIPVIFRPYHEHTGGWFWWGTGHCSIQEYNNIWRFTVEYLRDSLNVHNLIYALSPSAQNIGSVNDYYHIYPGDRFVDVFGFDNYFNSTISDTEVQEFKNDLRRVAQAAKDKGKVAAITEVGQENITSNDLFTKDILDPVKTDLLTRKMAYAAVWRNQDSGHHFAPYPGHSSVPDFLNFYNDPYTIFEDDLPDMYVLSYMDVTAPVFLSHPARGFTAFYTDVIVSFKTDERAFLRYSNADLAYANMPNEFQEGQGSRIHSTLISGSQGDSIHLFVRGADYNGNAMDSSVEVKFTIDTLQRPVVWNEKNYDTTGWQTGTGPFHFENSSLEGTSISYSRTVYLRKTFSASEVSSLFQMVAFVRYDNGFVLYVNGHEVRRVNIPDGEVNYQTWTGKSTQSFITLTLDSSVMAYLNDGLNVIALEVHQEIADSSDFKFDLKLIDPNIVIAYGSEWTFYAEGDEPAIKTIGVTDIAKQKSAFPAHFELAQNFPNPFNPLTTIRFALAKSGFVHLAVYNGIGQKVIDLVDRKIQPGWHSAQFNGLRLASGVYYYKLITQSGSIVRKMILLK